MSSAEPAPKLLVEKDEAFTQPVHVDVIDGEVVERQAQLPADEYACYHNYDPVDPGVVSRFVIDPQNPHLLLRIREEE